MNYTKSTKEIAWLGVDCPWNTKLILGAENLLVTTSESSKKFRLKKDPHYSR